MREELKANPPSKDFSPLQYNRKIDAKSLLFISPSAFPEAKELFLMFQ
jgi:hypothetical protein